MAASACKKKRMLPWGGRFNYYEGIVSLLLMLRPDLRKGFNIRNSVNVGFLEWLIKFGKRDYQVLQECEDLKNILSQPLKILDISPIQGLVYLEREDVRKVFPLPAKKQEFCDWFYKHGVDEHGLLQFLNQDEIEKYYARHPEKSRYEKIVVTEDDIRPFGANLIGYAFGELGIGEDVRMTAKALKKVGVPVAIVNFPPGSDIPQNDQSLKDLVSESAPYYFNIFCMTAFETGNFYMKKGAEIFKGRYNIGYWPWELSKWPLEWQGLTDLVDEVWVASRHIYDALSPVSDVPVLIMPLAVEIGEIANLSRKNFNLPENAYLFCFSFDPKSSIYRKNPQACLKSFQKAFPKEETDSHVGLVIKCHKPYKTDRYWEQLKKVAKQDKRIYIIERTLSRPDLLALYKCCDCFVSLHRAEGYGRGIAEAMLLGLDVIATNYSGNTDYCNMENAGLVDYHLVPVGKKRYYFGNGQVWGDPDIENAAELMKKYAKAGKKHGRNLVRTFPFDLVKAGKRYAKRLQFLRNDIKEYA